MDQTRRLIVFGAPLALVACGGPEPVWAPDDMVQRSVYVHSGPPQLTLFTMRNRARGTGMHTGLLVNASQRVLFDPAGTFAGSDIAERNDVIFGMTPYLEQYYIGYHARETYFVERQDIVVTPDVAELALKLVLANGAVAKTQCAVATGKILQQLPGFSSIRPGLFPGDLADQFGALPGVRTDRYYEDDSDNKEIARNAYERALRERAAPSAPAPRTE